MKSCPTCKRIYEDDTFTFCLDDGARLSPSSDATLHLPAELSPSQHATEILQPSVITQPARARETQQGAKTMVYGHEAWPAQPAHKPAGRYWPILAGVAVFLLAGVAIALGYALWPSGDKGATEPSENSSANTANSPIAGGGNSNSSNTNSEAADSLAWLEGVWEGTGYQTNPKSTWTMKLTVKNETFSIEYPSLSCKGRWNLLGKETGKARFKEVITVGLNRCENNGTVLVEKLDDSRISFKYSSPNTKAITSTATLRKSSTARD